MITEDSSKVRSSLGSRGGPRWGFSNMDHVSDNDS